MYLTLTSTAPAATDLGFLLHKHPERAQQPGRPPQRFDGLAHGVFWTSLAVAKVAVLV